MKFNFKHQLKEIGHTAVEVAVLTGGAIVSKKFMDFKTLFKNQIAADPLYLNKFWMVHEGGVKFAVGLAGASYFKNPYVKWAFIGVAVAGAFQEVRHLTAQGGAPIFDPIGNRGEPDAELVEAARNFMTRGTRYNAVSGSFVNDAPSAVANIAGRYDLDTDMAVGATMMGGPMMGVMMGQNGCGIAGW